MEKIEIAIHARGISTDASIISSPVKINNIYYLSTFGSGLYTSTDGINWNRDHARGIQASVKSDLTPVKIGRVYYLGTEEGLYTSNNGTIWNRHYADGIPTSVSISEDPVKIGAIYYVGTNGYGSSKGGLWTSKVVF